MSDSFNKDFGQIVLKPNDYKVDFQFEFPASTAATANDGFLPYDTTLTSVGVSGFLEDETYDSSLIVGTPSVLNNIVTVSMQYPDGGAGRYTLNFKLFESDVVYDARFASVFAFEN